MMTTKLKKSKSLPRQPFLFNRSKSDGGSSSSNKKTSKILPVSKPKKDGGSTSTTTKSPPGSSFLSGWMLLTPPTQLLRNRQAARRASTAATGEGGSRFTSSSFAALQPRTSTTTSTSTNNNATRPWTKSVLTQLLIRLDENLKDYCDCLATGKIASASLLLDTSEATLMTPTSSSTSSPASHTLSPSKTTSTTTMSPPTRTTMFVNNNISSNSVSSSWRGGGGGTAGVTGQARATSPLGKLSPSILALEAEWERYVSPFLCLAGAEAMYGQMEHILLADLDMKLVLKKLYQRIHQDLRSVKADLCDPFLVGSSNESSSEPLSVATMALTTATQAALSLSTSIQTLLQFVSIRQELLQLHMDMFVNNRGGGGGGNNGKDYSDTLMNKVQAIHDYHNSVSAGGGRTSLQEQQCTFALMTSLKDEIKATQAVISAVYELDRCSFMNSIIQTKILKNYRKSPPSSVLQVWLQLTLENILSVMPIFFDRIDAYSRPLYGFDKNRMIVADKKKDEKKEPHHAQQQQQQQMIGVVHDYDAFMVDFLRRHENKGGQSMAISIVLDAKRTGNLHLEHGVVATATAHTTPTTTKNNAGSTLPSSTSSQPPMNHEIDEWPAIYMRTTLHSTSFSNTSSNARSPLSRSPSSSSGRNSGVTKTSISSMMNKLGHNSRQMLKVPSARNVDDVVSTSAADHHHHHGGMMKSEGNLLRSWSNDTPNNTRKSTSGNADGSTRTTLSKRDHLNTVLEYAPDSGNLSWPHDEWSKLVPLLLHERNETDNSRNAVDETTNSIVSNQQDMDGGGSLASMTPSTTTTTSTPQAVTYQGVEESPSKNNNNNNNNNAGSNPSSPQRPPRTGNNSSHSTVSLPNSSIYHVNRLGEYMWIVVLVKREDGSKWHQRKRSRGHSDEEIRSFLEGIASKLRLESNIFGIESVQNAQLCSSKASKHICTTDLAKYCTLSSINSSDNSIKDDDDDNGEDEDDDDEDDSYWTDTDIDNFIIGMKDSFGLQPESRMRRALKGTRGWQTGGGGTHKSKFRSSTRRRGGGVNRQTRRSLDRQNDYDDDQHLDSAIAFFLGPDLMKTFE